MSLNLDAMAQEAVARLAQDTNRRVGQRLRRMRERWASEQGAAPPFPARRPEDVQNLQNALVGMPSVYVLRITPAIAHQWQARCIADVIPGLASLPIKAGRLGVDAHTLRAIAEDCRFMADVKAVDSRPGERHAYRSLLAHCEQVRLIGPVDQAEDAGAGDPP